MIGTEVFYIHRYQVVEFLVISNSPLCNLGLFQSEVCLVWGVFQYRKSNPGAFQVRIGGCGRRNVGKSTADDPGEDLYRGEPRERQIIDGGGSRRGPSSRGSATGSTHRRKRIKKRTFIQMISDYAELDKPVTAKSPFCKFAD